MSTTIATMSTTTAPPVHAALTVDMDGEHPVEKVTARLSPSTPLVPLAKDDDLNAEGKRQFTFIVELKSDGVQPTHATRRGKEATATGEQTSGSDDTPSPPDTPHERLSALDVDVVEREAAPESNTSDSESLRSPIDPPGLSEQVPSPAPDQASEGVPTEVRDEGVDPSAKPPAVDAPEELDAIFSIDPRVFEWELVYDISHPIFQLEPALFEHDLSRYSVSDLPQLDKFIPNDLFPDDLFVHDIDNITRVHPGNKDTDRRDLPVRYVRIYPSNSREQGESRSAYDDRDTSKPARFAHLYLKSANRMGTGHHSYVYRAPLTLRLDPDSGECSTATVAVKTANTECGAHLMLDKEAAAYNAFPQELMEDTLRSTPDTSNTDGAASPSDAVTTSESTQVSVWSDSHAANCLGPALQPATPAGTPPSETEAVWEPAVVPKFYGYYGALNADGSLHSARHGSRRCDIDDECYECGRPIEPPCLKREEREKVLALTARLHAAGFPAGPLSVPREERSEDTPSHRIIDFGRAEVLSLLPESRHAFFEECCEDDMDRAKRYLML
ncbi:hypothetical protein C8T65DRAFT_634986 [Cerioporus squamosus]|nr:hypothetical protein C8T65DRAFT_634986 [Cerioporus squamosus]